MSVNRLIFLGVLVLLAVFAAMNYLPEKTVLSEDKVVRKESMVLVLAAPSVDNEYYTTYFDKIVEFQVNYAQKVINHSADSVRILVDERTKEYYEGRLPDNVLVAQEMYDIWIRDFATVNPFYPVQFVYTYASMSEEESVITQRMFSDFADRYGIEREKTSYYIDGGNVVDNYAGRVVVTTRFLEDNDLEYDEGKDVLKELLRAFEVAIVEADDDVLAHADGMVAWLDDDVLAVNDYSKMDEEFHNLVMDELERSFADVKIVSVPVLFDNGGVDEERGIGSACGINLNLVATHSTLYVPVFGGEEEKEALAIIRANTKKSVVEIDAKNICLFGGSVRCTTWQLSESNAKGLL